MIIVTVVLVLIIATFIIWNMSLHKKIENLDNIHQKVVNLNIIQDFINIAGNNMTVDNKIKAINDVIIDKYEIKYSTIVLFDGTDYLMKATNVDSKHWDVLTTMHELDIFKDSILTTNPKYITVNNEKERLPYQKQEFGRARSAIFFPLYIDNVYIGYWLVESGVPHDFDNIDIAIFETARENIVSVLKAVDYQRTLENIARKDLFSGLYSGEYLYGEGKKIIDQYTDSAICMFRISNIEEINNISRELGNKVITKLCEHIKQNISPSYIFVRYMGPKFVIAFCGVTSDSASDFINEIKDSSEKLQISLKEEDFSIEEIGKESKANIKKRRRLEQINVSPTLNFVVSTYYKGTGIEEVLKKLEHYIDEANHEESQISSI